MQVNGIKTKKKQQAKEEFTAKQLKTRMIEASLLVYFIDSVWRKSSTTVLVLAEM